MFNKNLAFCIVFFVLTAPVLAQKSEQKAIRKAFETYKNAILNNKGEVAANCVDSRTITYYGKIAELVRHADSLKVASLNITDKLMVFSIRHRTSKEDILAFDGRSLLIYAIENGMVGKNSVSQKNTIGEVSINDEFAKGQFVFNGEKVPIYFDFYKEVGVWKIDLTSVFPLTSTVLENMAKEENQTENEFLFSILKLMTGVQPTNEIWQPVK